MNTVTATLPVDPPQRILLPALVGGCIAATLYGIASWRWRFVLVGIPSFACPGGWSA